jgi:hypothetical protein
LAAKADVLMPDEMDDSQPPQPILIQGGGIEPSEDDPTSQDDAPQPTPAEPVASPNDANPNATMPLALAIERYEDLNSKSDPGNGLAILGIVLMVVSLFIGVSAMIDGLSGGGGGGDDDAITLCFGGLFIGVLLGAGGLAQSASYQGEVKKALAEVKALADLSTPKKKVNSPVLTAGLIMSVLGFSITNVIESVVGPVLFCVGLLTLCSWALTGSTSEKPEDVLAAAKKELLRRYE